MTETTTDTERAAGHERLDDLRQMWRIRAFEERVQELRRDEVVVGSVHLSNGQEAIPVGAVGALSEVDAVFATYRGHGWAIACGAPLQLLFAELMGRATGVNGGRGGSAYLSAPDHRFYGENSIVGGGAPIATGAALAATFDGSGRVAVCVFGDGAMNQGSVHEAMNFAAAFDLPVVFVCENNRWSELTAISEMVRSDRLFERAAAYGMPGERIDGNDAAVVREAMGRAVSAARRGDGPTLLEAMTQRIVGHYIGDAEQYRSAEEIEAAKAAEPIARLRGQLLSEGAGAQEVDEVEQEARDEIERAATAAMDEPPADVSSVREHLYA